MGTISEKLTYLNGTKQELKQKINNLGGDITDNTTFRQYANQLQNVYDNLPKTEYQEGTEINLGKTIKGKLDYDNGVVGIGNTYQYSTQGYNLLPLTGTTYFEITSNGYKNKRQEGLFSINLTLEANRTYYLKLKLISKPTAATTFNSYKNTTASGTIINELTFANIQNDNYNLNQVYTKTYTTTEITPLSIRTWGNANNDTYEFQLWLTTDNSKDTYEPYTNGASPNPNYPQQIKSVTGEQTIYIKDGDNNVITTHQLSLGNIQLNAIGNYKDELIYDVDEDKVYKNEKIGKVIYTGNEEWTLVSSLSNSNRTVFQTVKPIGVYKYPITPQDFNEIAKVICNKFIPTSQQATWKYYEVGFRTAGAEYIYFIVEAGVTLQDFKTNIIKDTILNYLLATPTQIEITDTTLINQVKALYNAHSNNGTTIITSNGDLPMIIKVRTLKGE